MVESGPLIDVLLRLILGRLLTLFSGLFCGTCSCYWASQLGLCILLCNVLRLLPTQSQLMVICLVTSKGHVVLDKVIPSHLIFLSPMWNTSLECLSSARSGRISTSIQNAVPLGYITWFL